MPAKGLIDKRAMMSRAHDVVVRDFWLKNYPPGCLVEIMPLADHSRNIASGLFGNTGDIVAKCNNSISRFIALDPETVGIVMRFDPSDSNNILLLVGQEELWVRTMQCCRISDQAGDNVRKDAV